MPPFSPGVNAVIKTRGSAATAACGTAIRARAARAKANAQRSVVIEVSLVWDRAAAALRPQDPPQRRIEFHDRPYAYGAPHTAPDRTWIALRLLFAQGLSSCYNGRTNSQRRNRRAVLLKQWLQ